jgi:hypothetical protein
MITTDGARCRNLAAKDGGETVDPHQLRVCPQHRARKE